MQLGLAGALRDPEHLRRLPVRVPVQGMQHQGITRPIGKPADGALDLLHLQRRLERPPELPAVLLLGKRLDRGALAALGQAHVHRDAVQPGRQRAARLELRERPPCIDERVLRTVLRQLGVPRHAQAQPVDASGVLSIKSLERARVSGAGALHQRCLPVDPRVLRLHLCHLPY